jgi:5'-nucleotidase
MRRILITNDDGINSEGLYRLADAATKLGQVWVVAPDSERSAMSHSVTLRREVEVWEVPFPVEGVKAFACDGKPADCVRVGVLNIVVPKPDMVFSGINYGYNVAADLQYSATVGAAFEAAFQECHAIAFSEGAREIHEVADDYLLDIMKKLADKPLARGQIWNVNFPASTRSECKGIAYNTTVSTDGFYKDRYKETVLSNGRRSYMVDGIRNWDAQAGTDLRAVLDNYISVGVAHNIS